MIRLDKLLVDQGLAESRTQAQKLIAYGAVQVCIQGMWMTLDKASVKYPQDITLRVEEISELKYASRAGLKLESALKHLCENQLLGFNKLDKIAQGVAAIDIGQSTGGFTDCLLAHGAEQVIGIDVGHDQLAEPLKNDNRVVCIEGVNARNPLEETIRPHRSESFDWAVIDVSFISQTLIHPNIGPLLNQSGLLISLVKPQFEVGRKQVGKGGIVKNQDSFDWVEDKIETSLKNNHFQVEAYFESGLRGADGNTEFFVIAKKAI